MTEKRFNFGVHIHYKIQDDVKYERRFSDLEGFLEEDYDGEHHMLWDSQEECWVHLDEALEIMEKEYNALHEENKNTKAVLNDFMSILNRLQANPTDKKLLGVARDMLQNMGVDLE